MRTAILTGKNSLFHWQRDAKYYFYGDDSHNFFSVEKFTTFLRAQSSHTKEHICRNKPKKTFTRLHFN